MNKNLIIVRAGENSLHEKWQGKDQNFDLIVSYYGKDIEKFKGKNRFDFIGSKFEGLYDCIKNQDINLNQYNYIWIPDDDLYTTSENINNFFNIVNEYNLKIAQPSLINTGNKFYSHITTLQHKSFKLRYTNFVEIMAPCLRKDFLKEVIETFKLTKSGWGLDFLWPKLAGEKCSAIIDATPIIHTRTVGQDYSWLGINPKKESRIFDSYNLDSNPKNFIGILLDGREVVLNKASIKQYLSPDEFSPVSWQML